MADYPDDLRYTKEHEWARIEGKTVTIGVTKFAVEQLRDVIQVDLPKEGEVIKKDEVVGTLESTKTVSDVFAPISGKILKVNSPLADSPEYITDEPYGEGWLIQVEASTPSELDGLMSAAEYAEFVKDQG